MGFTLMIILYTTGKVYAIKAKEVYNPVNVTISNILKSVPLILIIIYIIGVIIYYFISKQDKKYKLKKSLIWLSIIAIIGVTSYFCAEPVLREGMSYSSSQEEFRNYRRNMRNEKYNN